MIVVRKDGFGERRHIKWKCIMGKIITLQDWQERSNSTHGVDVYTILGKREGRKLSIRHEECGKIFTQRSGHHVAGSGCPECAVTATRITLGEWQEKSDAKHGYGAYVIEQSPTSGSDPVFILHAVCGRRFKQRLKNHTLGASCPKCAAEKSRHSMEEWQKKSSTTHNEAEGYTILELEESMGEKSLLLHQKCKRTFRQSIAAHVAGQNCPLCSMEAKVERMTHTLQEWQEKSDEKHGKNAYVIINLGSTECSKATIKHNVCGNTFTQLVNGHIRRGSCPTCSHKSRAISQESYQFRSDTVHSKGEYIITSLGGTAKADSEVYHTKCGKTFIQSMDSHTRGTGCPSCANRGVSKGENSLAEALQSLDLELEILRSNRKILGNRKELDIVFPTQKIAVEYCGIFWHSEAFKTKKYHKDKYSRALEKGYHLVTVFEDEYLENPEKVIAAIRSLLGLSIKGKGARQLEVKKVDTRDSRKFFTQHHLQGPAAQSVTYGLYDSEDLVAAMSFSRPQRPTENYKWELRRFATDGHKHAGAASRLFSMFLKEYNPDSVGSMSDNRWFSGGMYAALGFELDGDVNVDYYYVKNGKRYNKSGFRISCIAVKLPEFYVKGKTENR